VHHAIHRLSDQLQGAAPAYNYKPAGGLRLNTTIDRIDVVRAGRKAEQKSPARAASSCRQWIADARPSCPGTGRAHRLGAGKDVLAAGSLAPACTLRRFSRLVPGFCARKAQEFADAERKLGRQHSCHALAPLTFEKSRSISHINPGALWSRE
jgi:hypothetical protein